MPRACENGSCENGSLCVNVNTKDATVGATALLLPAQNTHTLQLCVHDLSPVPKYG